MNARCSLSNDLQRLNDAIDYRVCVSRFREGPGDDIDGLARLSAALLLIEENLATNEGEGV